MVVGGGRGGGEGIGLVWVRGGGSEVMGGWVGLWNCGLVGFDWAGVVCCGRCGEVSFWCWLVGFEK